MIRRVVVVVALVSGAFAALAFAARGANHTNTIDPNDTDGRLDLGEIAFDHYPGPLEWTFRTFGTWRLADVWDRGFFVIELDTHGGKAVDERIVVRSDGRTMEGLLIAVRPDGVERLRRALSATKGSSRTASVEIALRRLAIGRSRTVFRWYAYSIFTGSGCIRACIDRVPDAGRLEEELPGAPPTPSPTGPTGTGPTGTTT